MRLMSHSQQAFKEEYLLYAKNLFWAFVFCVEYRNNDIKFLIEKVDNSVSFRNTVQERVLEKCPKLHANKNTFELVKYARLEEGIKSTNSFIKGPI